MLVETVALNHYFSYDVINRNSCILVSIKCVVETQCGRNMVKSIKESQKQYWWKLYYLQLKFKFGLIIYKFYGVQIKILSANLFYTLFY